MKWLYRTCTTCSLKVETSHFLGNLVDFYLIFYTGHIVQLTQLSWLDRGTESTFIVADF